MRARVRVSLCSGAFATAVNCTGSDPCGVSIICSNSTVVVWAALKILENTYDIRSTLYPWAVVSAIPIAQLPLESPFS